MPASGEFDQDAVVAAARTVSGFALFRLSRYWAIAVASSSVRYCVLCVTTSAIEPETAACLLLPVSNSDFNACSDIPLPRSEGAYQPSIIAPLRYSASA